MLILNLKDFLVNFIVLLQFYYNQKQFYVFIFYSRVGKYIRLSRYLVVYIIKILRPPLSARLDFRPVEMELYAVLYLIINWKRE